MMALNVRKIIIIILMIVMISTASCDARPKNSENNTENQLVVVRMDRGGGGGRGGNFVEPLPFIGTSIALSLGNKLQRYGLGILVGPMLRIVNFLYKIHLWFK